MSVKLNLHKAGNGRQYISVKRTEKIRNMPQPRVITMCIFEDEFEELIKQIEFIKNQLKGETNDFTGTYC